MSVKCSLSGARFLRRSILAAPSRIDKQAERCFSRKYNRRFFRRWHGRTSPQIPESGGSAHGRSHYLLHDRINSHVKASPDRNRIQRRRTVLHHMLHIALRQLRTVCNLTDDLIIVISNSQLIGQSLFRSPQKNLLLRQILVNIILDIGIFSFPVGFVFLSKNYSISSLRFRNCKSCRRR